MRWRLGWARWGGVGWLSDSRNRVRRLVRRARAGQRADMQSRPMELALHEHVFAIRNLGTRRVEWVRN